MGKKRQPSFTDVVPNGMMTVDQDFGMSNLHSNCPCGNKKPHRH